MTDAEMTMPQGPRRSAMLPVQSRPSPDADDSFAACLGGWHTGQALVALAPPLPVMWPMNAGAGPAVSLEAEPHGPAGIKPWSGKALFSVANRDATVPPDSQPPFAAAMMTGMTVKKQERFLPPPFASGSAAGLTTAVSGQQRDTAPVHSLTLHVELGNDRHITLSMHCRHGVIDLHVQPDTPETRALVLAQAAEIQQVLMRKGIPAGPIVIADQPGCAAESRAVHTPATAGAEPFIRSTQNQVSFPHGPQQDLLERRRGSRRHHF